MITIRKMLITKLAVSSALVTFAKKKTNILFIFKDDIDLPLTFREVAGAIPDKAN